MFLGDVPADYVYRGARVRWTAGVDVQGNIFQADPIIGPRLAAGYWPAVRSAIEQSGFVNVSGDISGFIRAGITVEATAGSDFAHAPDIRHLFEGIAYQQGLNISSDSTLSILQQGSAGGITGGNTGTNTGNPVTVIQGGQPATDITSQLAAGFKQFSAGLGLSTPVAIAGGLIVILLIARR